MSLIKPVIESLWKFPLAAEDRPQTFRNVNEKTLAIACETLKNLPQKNKNAFLGNVRLLNQASISGVKEILFSPKGALLIRSIREYLQAEQISDAGIKELVLEILENHEQVYKGRDWRDLYKEINKHLSKEERLFFVDIKEVSQKILSQDPVLQGRNTFTTVDSQVIQEQIDFERNALIYDALYKRLTVIDKKEVEGLSKGFEEEVIEQLVLLCNDAGAFQEEILDQAAGTPEQNTLHFLENFHSLLTRYKGDLRFPEVFFLSGLNTIIPLLRGGHPEVLDKVSHLLGQIKKSAQEKGLFIH